MNMKAFPRSIRRLRATFVDWIALNRGFVSFCKHFIHDKHRIDYLSTTIHVFLDRVASTQVNADDVVFLGDSITAGGSWSKWFDNPHLKNRGRNRCTTKGILNTLDAVIQARPSKIFLMVGIADLDRGRSLTGILDNYRRILTGIIRESPETLVYVQSVLPINSAMAISSHVTNDSVVTLNAEISQLSNELGVNFIDLYSRFVNDGQLNESYTDDGIHLNRCGYLVWKEAIGSLV